MHIRSATSFDVSSVLDVWSLADAEPTVTDDAASLRALLNREPDGLLVAEHDGEVIGTLIATWDGWRGHFYRLAVLPEHRRLGIASSLVAEAERRLESRGARRVNAIVVESDKRATAFWAAAHFEMQSNRLRFVKNAPSITRPVEPDP
jgi:ribosomal protein S18 acetylase RimI-like enzyme